MQPVGKGREGGRKEYKKGGNKGERRKVEERKEERQRWRNKKGGKADPYYILKNNIPLYAETLKPITHFSFVQ